MNGSSTDQNLLFGVLALQLDFIDREALIAGMHAWVLEKSKSLGQILVERGRLSTDRLSLLQSLVAEHLKQHAGDAQRSLAAIHALEPVRRELQDMADADVQASLARVTAKVEPDSLFVSPTLEVGVPSSQGQRFRILRPFAKGGLGQVSVAQDLELHRDVALKEIQPQYADNGESRTRFILEAEITGALEHPGIVPVYGLGQYVDGRPFYAMRFIRGDTLQEAIRRFHGNEVQRQDGGQRALELRKLLGRFIDVCNAIDYAHSRGVLHRDLKPGNVMLGKYGETLVVDWGLAKPMSQTEQPRGPAESVLRPASGSGSTPTQMGTAIGTPAYMSPEQAAGRLDQIGPASDVYSLGATLYHLLTGHPPLEGPDVGRLLLRAERGEFPRPREVNPRIPAALESICLMAMALDPSRRYASAGKLADDVEHWLGDEPVGAHCESWSQRIGRWTRRHRSWTQAGAAALLAVAVISGWAAVLVIRAQRQEAKAWELTAKTREVDLRLLQEPAWDETSLSEVERQIEDIAQLSPPDADLRRTRLYEVYAAELKRALEVPRFDDDNRARFDFRLATLEARADGADSLAGQLARELRDARDARLRRWDSLFRLEAPLTATHQSVFDPSEVFSDDDALRRVAAAGESYRAVLARVACPAGNIELKATFGRGWVDSAVVGLLLNSSPDHGYAFLVASPLYDYRDATPEELLQLPPMWEVVGRAGEERLSMYILRDGQPLRKTPLAVGPGRLKMLARREGGTLSLTINDVQTIKFDDPFPLSNDASGKFGVYWPAGVTVESLQAMRLRSPQAPSPIEAGDQLFAHGEFSDALAAFRNVETLEARYKAALCQLALADVTPAVATLVELAGQSAGVEKTADDAWRLRAGCRLLQYRIESKQWDEVRKLLTELANYFDREEVARLIPATQHELIFQQFRRSGSRSRFWNTATNAIEDLKWTLLVEELFNEDAAQRRMTKWRLADAYRWAREPDEAKEILQGLLAASDANESISQVERVALVGDLVWLLTANGDFAGAQRELNHWLLDDAGKYRTEFLPLLVNRAAGYMNLGEPEKAIADLDRFFDEVPVKTISHAQFARACALRGMLYEDQGNEEEAQKVWRRGLRRNWHEGYLDPKELSKRRGLQMVLANESLKADQVLASWTGELTEEETVRLAWNFAPGSGFFSTSLRRLAETTLEPALARAVVLRMFQTPEGRDYARLDFLGRQPMYAVSSAQFGFAELTKLGCLSDVEITPAFDAFIAASCRRLMEMWYKNDWGQEVVQEILTLWRGNFSRRGFARLEQVTGTQDPELFESMCFVLGNRFALQGKKPVAEFLFNHVIQSGRANPLIEDLARRQLIKLSTASPAKPAGPVN